MPGVISGERNLALLHYSYDGNIEDTRRALGVSVNLFGHIIQYDEMTATSKKAAIDSISSYLREVSRQCIIDRVANVLLSTSLSIT